MKTVLHPGRRLFLRATAAVALGVALVACDKREVAAVHAPVFNGVDLTGADWGRDFHLADQGGRARSLADFRGKVVLLYFGYLNCPDMCPTMVSQMAQVRARMGADRDLVQGLFVTVDPKRDTRDALGRYLASFDPTFLGLSGDEHAIAALAADFRVFFKAQPAGPHGTYTVDHSGGVYVFDPRGRLRLMLRPGTPVDAMAADVAQLLREQA